MLERDHLKAFGTFSKWLAGQEFRAVCLDAKMKWSLVKLRLCDTAMPGQDIWGILRKTKSMEDDQGYLGFEEPGPQFNVASRSPTWGSVVCVGLRVQDLLCLKASGAQSGIRDPNPG